MKLIHNFFFSFLLIHGNSSKALIRAYHCSFRRELFLYAVCLAGSCPFEIKFVTSKSKRNFAYVTQLYDFLSFHHSCGSDSVSQDLDDTLSYNCTVDSKYETFSLKTYRYFGADPNEDVYIHCDFRVCLADVTGSACECPSDPSTCTGSRRRRSIYDSVDESQLYHVVYGPFTFKQEELNKDEGK